MSMRVIHIALGQMGRAWIRAVGATEEVHSVAYVEPDPIIREARIREDRLDRDRCYATLADALHRVEADGIILAAPPAAHEGICVEAAQAGLHVLCEKPLATTLASARRAVEAAETAGVVLMVAQNRRHAPFVETLRRQVAGDVLGPPGQVFVDSHHTFSLPSFWDSMAHPLLFDMASHHFDMIRYV